MSVYECIILLHPIERTSCDGRNSPDKYEKNLKMYNAIIMRISCGEGFVNLRPTQVFESSPLIVFNSDVTCFLSNYDVTHFLLYCNIPSIIWDLVLRTLLVNDNLVMVVIHTCRHGTLCTSALSCCIVMLRLKLLKWLCDHLTQLWKRI